MHKQEKKEIRWHILIQPVNNYSECAWSQYSNYAASCKIEGGLKIQIRTIYKKPTLNGKTDQLKV